MINEKWNKNFRKVVSISWKLPLYLRIPEWPKRVFQIWRKMRSHTFKKYFATVSHVSGGNQKLYSQSKTISEISWHTFHVRRMSPLRQFNSECSSTLHKMLLAFLTILGDQTKIKGIGIRSGPCRYDSFSLYQFCPSWHQFYHFLSCTDSGHRTKCAIKKTCIHVYTHTHTQRERIYVSYRYCEFRFFTLLIPKEESFNAYKNFHYETRVQVPLCAARQTLTLARQKLSLVVDFSNCSFLFLPFQAHWTAKCCHFVT